MKKLVCIVLILVILNEFAYCAAAAGLKEEWQKVKAVLQKAKNWLIEKGLWTPLVNAIKEGGKALALTVCKKKCADPSICSDIVNWVFNHMP